MPKVTVVTLPEEMIIPQELSSPAVSPSPKTGKRKPVISGVWRAMKKAGAVLANRDTLFIAIVALLLSRVAIVGELNPFGLAFFAAVVQTVPERAAVTACWSLAGILSLGNFAEAGIYLVVFMLYFRWKKRLFAWFGRRYVFPLALFGTVAAAGVAATIVQQGALYGMVTAFLDAAMCTVAAYIFSSAMPLLLSRTKILAACRQAANETLICLVVVLAVAITGLGDAVLWGYSIRNIAGGVLVLLLAMAGGSGMGAAVGVAIGLVAGVSEGNAPLNISLYAVSGMLAGIFRSLGRVAVFGGFILGSMIVNLWFTPIGDLFHALTEAVVTAALFLLLPVGQVGALRDSLCCPQAVIKSPDFAEANEKLANIARIFQELAATFGTSVVNSKDKLREEELAKVLTAVGEQVCESCPQRSKCWDENFYRTYQAMLDIFEQAEKGRLTGRTLPDLIKDTCISREELTTVVMQVIERRHTVTFWQKKLTEQRQMVSEQLKSVGIIIDNLAREVEKEPEPDLDLAQALKEKAAILDCCLDSVTVTGLNGLRNIEIYKRPCDGGKECLHTILPLASRLIQEKMSLHAQCGKSDRGTKCRLKLQAVQRLAVETGMASAAKEQGVCGDSCAVVQLPQGKVALMLSDGMGSGRQAAGESLAAVDFLTKLLAAGFSVEVAVKTVNSLLVLRTPDERFATVDMTVIDTYSGATEFLKIGSAPSFVKRVCEVTTIHSASLPMGIVNDMEFEPVNAVVAAGDLLVMVSDGIVDVQAAKECWIVNYLRRTTVTHPQELADLILHEAIEMSGGHVRDDMMVFAARIGEQN